MKRVGGHCSNPKCGVATIGPSTDTLNKSDTIGVAAHIMGAMPLAARYSIGQTEEERHSIENGIWLCSNCASLIDKNCGSGFPVSVLKLWKLSAEKAARESLVGGSSSVKENCIENLIYINVPRLFHYSELTQPSSSFPTTFIEEIPSHGLIIEELVKMERAIAATEIPAYDWKDVADNIEDPTGMLIRFEGRFWTKNAPARRSPKVEAAFSSISKAPHIYAKHKGVKLVLPYDPRFITTNTAFVQLSSGCIKVGGFAFVRSKEGDVMVASPLFIGTWSSPEARAFMNAMRIRN